MRVPKEQQVSLKGNEPQLYGLWVGAFLSGCDRKRQEDNKAKIMAGVGLG